MKKQEPLEKPQESILETIKEELDAEAAHIPVENTESLQPWSKIHSIATIGIYASLIGGMLLSVLIGLMNPKSDMTGVALPIIASSLCSITSITIAVIKPGIFTINNDGTKRSQKIARRRFLLFWLIEGLPIAAILLLGIMMLMGKLF